MREVRLPKKKIFIVSIIIFVFIAAISFLRMDTITQQGINYEVTAIKIPLYLKLHNFFDRHLNYKWILGKIVNDRMTEQEKAEAIFTWTIQHIVRQPSQLPIIDDHPWHIIVRGYGTEDQMADVFAVLSNYAGLRSFILKCEGVDGADPGHICIGAVFFDGSWHLCDPYRRTIFLKEQNKWASISDLAGSGWKIKSIGITGQRDESIYYKDYFQNLAKVDYDDLHRYHRSAIQDPLSRFRFFLKNRKI